jgi:hypothetical protein
VQADVILNGPLLRLGNVNSAAKRVDGPQGGKYDPVNYKVDNRPKRPHKHRVDQYFALV